MKTLTIGSTTIEITDFKKCRDKMTGVYALIKIPKANIEYNALEALLTDNKEDMIVTEADGTFTKYSGYEENAEIRVRPNEYIVEQNCTSEALHLLNEARKQIAEQQDTMTEMQYTIDTQNAELFAQAEVIVLQGETIATQNEQVAALIESIAVVGCH